MRFRSGKSDWLILLAMGLLFFGAMFFVWLLGGMSQGARHEPPTTYSSKRNGLMGVYLLWEGLSYDVARLQRKVDTEALSNTDVLVVVTPVVEFKPGETEALREWLQEGGILICHGLEPYSPGTYYDYPDVGPWERPITDGEHVDRVPRHHRDLTLSRDVKRVAFSGASWRESGVEDGRLLFRTHAHDIAAQKEGRGCVIVVSDPSFLFNRHLSKADNAVLATNLVAYALERSGGSRVAFDEYHHGYGWREGTWGTLAAILVGTPAGWAVLCLTLAGMMYLFLKGRRFGTRREPPRPERRSKLEYVHAAGVTWTRAGAHGMTLRTLFEWLRRKFARHLALGPTATWDEIVGCLPMHEGPSAARLTALIRECDAAAASKLTERNLNRLARQLARIEQELMHGHPNRK